MKADFKNLYKSNCFNVASLHYTDFGQNFAFLLTEGESGIKDTRGKSNIKTFILLFFYGKLFYGNYFMANYFMANYLSYTD